MIVFFSIAAFCAWIYLSLGHGGFWHGDQRLKPLQKPSKAPPLVAIIPARDEAETIGDVISAWRKVTYSGPLTLILVDDQSTDSTADIARAAWGDATNLTANRQFEIVDSQPLPKGWTGKLWALEQGFAHAREMQPDAEYVTLTDADIRLAPDTPGDLVAKAERENLSLASLMARLDTRGWGILLIPAFIYFFQQLYPFPRANNPDDNMAAAAGGCLLVRKEALETIGGFGAVKDKLIDDCAIARKVKDISPATKTWIGLADDEAVSLRDNRDLNSIWNMVARTAYAQLNFSPLLLVISVVGLTVLYLFPPLIFLTWMRHGSSFAALTGLGSWLLMARTYWPTLQLYHRPNWEAFALPGAAALYLAMTGTSALRHWGGRGGQWKGRTY